LIRVLVVRWPDADIVHGRRFWVSTNRTSNGKASWRGTRVRVGGGLTACHLAGNPQSISKSPLYVQYITVTYQPQNLETAYITESVEDKVSIMSTVT